MSTKRVILANGSRLMREAFQHVINRADRLEVVPEAPDPQDLPSVIDRFGPQWVFISSQQGGESGQALDHYLSRYPSVRFVVISPDHTRIRLQSQAGGEEDLTHLSLDDFIHVLERDVQPT
jgi:chemotaxis response regulator CheB